MCRGGVIPWKPLPQSYQERRGEETSSGWLPNWCSDPQHRWGREKRKRRKCFWSLLCWLRRKVGACRGRESDLIRLLCPQQQRQNMPKTQCLLNHDSMCLQGLGRVAVGVTETEKGRPMHAQHNPIAKAFLYTRHAQHVNVPTLSNSTFSLIY